MLDGLTPKVGTAVGAAMETAGAFVQSNILDFISGEGGQLLAGLLYLLSIASALIVFASGGNYRWGRYLLVGPTLFMFCTTVRTDSDGADWSWGTQAYSRESVDYALRGIVDTGSGGGSRVSVVFQFWNIFMSEVTHGLITLLNFDKDQSNLTFVKKVEDYMNEWNFSQIKDGNLKMLIKTTLAPKCRDYFAWRYQEKTFGGIDGEKVQAKARADAVMDHEILRIDSEAPTDRFARSVWQWAKDNNLDNQVFTCDTLWKAMIEKLVPDVVGEIEETRKNNRRYEQNEDIDIELLGRKMSEYVGRHSDGIYTSEFTDKEAALLNAARAIIARSLAMELGAMNKYNESHFLDNYAAIHQEDAGGEISGRSVRSTDAIQQFNVTEKYAMRSLYMKAMMSLPYIQGVGLLLLSAAFPFFALFLIVPGRAAGIFTWFSLWAWLKLWDLGFALVTMIDNMLYSMFPKAENVTEADLEDLGAAWVKVFEVDPSYSMATYYNLIATCLLAVPLVTAVFVKGGGNELVNVLSGAWSDYAFRVAGGAASYARSIQAQTMMKGLDAEKEQLMRGAEITGLARADKKGLLSQQYKLSVLIGGLEQASNFKLFGMDLKDPAGVLAVTKAHFTAKREQLNNQINAIVENDKAQAMFVLRKGAGRYIANRANASRYYSHELMNDLPFRAEFKEEMTKEYYDLRKPLGAGIKKVEDATQGAVGNK